MWLRFFVLFVLAAIARIGSAEEDCVAEERSTMSSWLLEKTRQIVPRLNRSMHKGQAGRIGIVGGSFEYCGAPYYAAMSTLQAGGDLSFIFCSKDAAIPIKSYSPEFIVIPALDSGAKSLNFALSTMERLHALVVGPGLGRDEQVLASAGTMIERARELELGLVLDGDALFLLGQNLELVRGNENAVLTPNVVEFKRLYKAVFDKDPSFQFDAQAWWKDSRYKDGTVLYENDVDAELKRPDETPIRSVVELARALGNVTIIQKGPIDLITNGHQLVVSGAYGSPRRCGGQGDVLAGTTGLFLNWAMKYQGGPDEKTAPIGKTLLAAYGASSLTRLTNKLAFAKRKRSMTTPDMIHEIHQGMEALFPIPGE